MLDEKRHVDTGLPLVVHHALRRAGYDGPIEILTAARVTDRMPHVAWSLTFAIGDVMVPTLPVPLMVMIFKDGGWQAFCPLTVASCKNLGSRHGVLKAMQEIGVVFAEGKP